MVNNEKDTIIYTEEELKKIHAEDKVIRKNNLENKKAAAQHKK